MLRLLLFGWLWSWSIGAQNFSAVYSFANVTNSSGTLSPAPQPTALGLSFKPFSANGVSANSSASGRFSFTGWPPGALNGDDDYANYGGQMFPFTFYEFSIEAQHGYTFSISDVSFSVRRSGTGPRNFCVHSSLDDFAENLSATTGTNTNIQAFPDNVFFWRYDSISTSSDQKGCALALVNTHKDLTAIIFRFYAWNSEASGGSFSLDNVTINGLVRDSVNTALKEWTALDVKCFPNPAFPGEAKLNDESDEIRIYNVSGDLIAQSCDSRVLSDLIVPGVYTIVLVKGTRSGRGKLLIMPR